jgi:hypothetical protein
MLTADDHTNDDDVMASLPTPITTTSTTRMRPPNLALLQHEDSSGGVIDQALAEETLDEQSLPELKEESNNNDSTSNCSTSNYRNNKTTVMGDEVLHESTKLLHRPMVVVHNNGNDADEDTLADHLGAQEFVKQMVNTHHHRQYKQQATAAFRVSQISDVTGIADVVGPSTPTATTNEANQTVSSAWSSWFPFYNNKTLNHHSNSHQPIVTSTTGGSPSMNRPIYSHPSGRGISRLQQQQQPPKRHPTAMTMIQHIRQSRFSQSVSAAVATAGQTLSQVEQQAEAYIDPQKTHSNTFATHVLYLFGSMQIMTTFILVTSTGRYPTWWATLPIFLLAIMGLLVTVQFTESLTRGERLFTVVGCWSIWALSSCSTYVATSACTHCVYYWVMETMSSPPKWHVGSPSSSSNRFKNTGGDDEGDKGRLQQLRQQQEQPVSGFSLLWDLLTSPSVVEPNTLVGSCRPCVRSVVQVLDYLFPPKDLYEHQRQQLEEEQENALFADISPYQTATSMFGDLASWYLYHNNQTRTKHMDRFNRKIVRALSDEGHLNDEALAEAMTEFFCSPASRFDNPDPNLYLADLKRPRFTGEQELNISASALQSIMRGDPLQKMGVTVCFMLRFALMVPKDYELEHKPIQYTQLKPSMNEEGMRSKDYSSGLPFLITPGRDQDIDYDSVEMDRFGAIMDIFGAFFNTCYMMHNPLSHSLFDTMITLAHVRLTDKSIFSTFFLLSS